MVFILCMKHCMARQRKFLWKVPMQHCLTLTLVSHPYTICCFMYIKIHLFKMSLLCVCKFVVWAVCILVKDKLCKLAQGLHRLTLLCMNLKRCLKNIIGSSPEVYLILCKLEKNMLLLIYPSQER